MSEIKFVINGKMELCWNGEIYKTDIQELNKDYMSISMPLSEGKLLPLGKGDILELIYYQNLYLFRFSVKALDRHFDGRVHQIDIEYPKTWEKIQRRSYVRINNVEYINIMSLDQLSEINSEEKPKIDKALLIDLSGGGMKIKSAKLLEENEKIIVFINNENVNLKIPVEVVRRIKDEDNRFIYGVKFDNINEKLREKIIQYVFSIMRKQMKQE